MKAWLRRAGRVLIDVIWPRGFICLICDELAEDGCLCSECRKQLEEARLTDQSGSVRSAYRYYSPAGKLVKAFKFRLVVDSLDILADAMAEEARVMNLPEDTVITWVTMPGKRMRERGIDHGRTLAVAVGERLGLPVKKLLIRRKDGRTQRGLNKADRLKNLAGKFWCGKKLTTPVLLIDDVRTTGATIDVCRRALLTAGAPAVFALTATWVINMKGDFDYGLYAP